MTIFRLSDTLWVNSQRSLEYEPLYPGSTTRPVYISAPDHDTTDIELTFALVKNYHAEFYVQPKLTGLAPAPPGKPAGR